MNYGRIFLSFVLFFSCSEQYGEQTSTLTRFAQAGANVCDAAGALMYGAFALLKQAKNNEKPKAGALQADFHFHSFLQDWLDEFKKGKIPQSPLVRVAYPLDNSGDKKTSLAALIHPIGTYVTGFCALSIATLLLFRSRHILGQGLGIAALPIGLSGMYRGLKELWPHQKDSTIEVLASSAVRAGKGFSQDVGNRIEKLASKAQNGFNDFMNQFESCGSHASSDKQSVGWLVLIGKNGSNERTFFAPYFNKNIAKTVAGVGTTISGLFALVTACCW